MPKEFLFFSQACHAESTSGLALSQKRRVGHPKALKLQTKGAMDYKLHQI